MQPMSRLPRLIPLLYCLFLPGCPADEREPPTRAECSELATTFFRQPVKAQLVEFSTYELDRQYVVFICGNEHMEPPAQYLAEPFSKRGELAVPFLKSKLETTHNERAIRYIVYVLSEMSWRKTYDVKGDAELMQLMKRRTLEIQDEFWREFTLKLIADIDAGK